VICFVVVMLSGWVCLVSSFRESEDVGGSEFFTNTVESESDGFGFVFVFVMLGVEDEESVVLALVVLEDELSTIWSLEVLPSSVFSECLRDESEASSSSVFTDKLES